MDLQTFRASLTGDEPAALPIPLRALWHEGRGDWHRAHDLLQSDEDGDGAWVHAYLHRKEGDLANAGYWYRRAGRPTATGSLEGEWDAIAAELLGREGT